MKTTFQKLGTITLLAAVLSFAVGANAATLFYGGNFNPNDPNANGLANENDAIVNGNPYGAAVYQNFIIGSNHQWQVTDLFTNELTGQNPTTAYWEIRSGISEGNGGTLIASGTAPDNLIGNPNGTVMNKVAVNVPLGTGTYWFAVVPQAPNDPSRGFSANTFGQGSIGNQMLDQQYWNSPFFGANFTNANNEGVFPSFSKGVIGTDQVVPEPSSLIMLGSGLLGAATMLRRRILG